MQVLNKVSNIKSNNSNNCNINTNNSCHNINITYIKKKNIEDVKIDPHLNVGLTHICLCA
jgi:hypothetical protein